jgi:hypothetical protein
VWAWPSSPLPSGPAASSAAADAQVLGQVAAYSLSGRSAAAAPTSGQWSARRYQARVWRNRSKHSVNHFLATGDKLGLMPVAAAGAGLGLPGSTDSSFASELLPNCSIPERHF